MPRQPSFPFVASASRCSVGTWLICATLRLAGLFKAYWHGTVFSTYPMMISAVCFLFLDYTPPTEPH